MGEGVKARGIVKCNFMVLGRAERERPTNSLARDNTRHAASKAFYYQRCLHRNTIRT